MARRLIKWGIKLGMVGGAVYVTKEAGFWKDSQTSEKLFIQILSFVKPFLKEIDVPEIPQLPRAEDISRSMKNAWNYGVITTVRFIADSPQHISDLYGATKDFASTIVSPTEEK